MKNWCDNKGNVWHRGPVKDSVTIHREWVLPIGDGCFEWVTIPGQRLNKNDREDAIAAIAKLWPPPTKAQLWRRVTRLAGEALFLQGANGCPFPMEGTDNAVYEIKYIIDSLRDYHNEKFENKANRLGEKLEAALAEYEAAL